MISMHKFNEYSRLSKVVELLDQGADLAIISDAGTPLISDPGRLVIEYAFNNQIPVIPIPGPSSLSAILSVCGFDLKKHPPVFLGFLDGTGSKLRNELTTLFNLNFCYVIFEAPHRINKLLNIIKEIDNKAELVLGRELTKSFEELKKIKLDQELVDIKEKGELVLVVLPSKKSNNINKVFDINHDLGEARQISKILANYLNIDQKKAYSMLVQLKEAKD